MARLSRLVLPGFPYHVTQRGNRRMQTFFEDGDYELYHDLLADARPVPVGTTRMTGYPAPHVPPDTGALFYGR